jgi:hypothetical protein
MSSKRNILGGIIFIMASLAVFTLLDSGCGKKEKPRPAAPEKQKPAASVEAMKAAETQPAARPYIPTEKKERTLYSFEKTTDGWEVPDWAMDERDYVARKASVSKDVTKDGAASLRVDTEFPGKVWTAALVEVMEYLDFTPYSEISCDIYIPKNVPEGLKAKIILTVGDNWKFTEMARSIQLIPGEWTHLRANLLAGSDDWKATAVDDAFRRDVRKIAIRVESNRSPVYSGPVYIDNIRVANP